MSRLQTRAPGAGDWGQGLAARGQRGDGPGVEGGDVARRRACVTPAARGPLGVSAAGLGNLPGDAARDLVWGRGDAGLQPIPDCSESVDPRMSMGDE